MSATAKHYGLSEHAFQKHLIHERRYDRELALKNERHATAKEDGFLEQCDLRFARSPGRWLDSQLPLGPSFSEIAGGQNRAENHRLPACRRTQVSALY